MFISQVKRSKINNQTIIIINIKIQTPKRIHLINNIL